jgi:hypothetical protein
VRNEGKHARALRSADHRRILGATPTPLHEPHLNIVADREHVELLHAKTRAGKNRGECMEVRLRNVRLAPLAIAHHVDELCIGGKLVAASNVPVVAHPPLLVPAPSGQASAPV